MKVGVIGLGKLGLPVALAIEDKGHRVLGWDTNAEIRQMVLERGQLPYVEEGAQELLDRNSIEVVVPEQIAEEADLVFVAVQTPHQPQYEGASRLPDTRADFDYSYLESAVRAVVKAECIVVISTVLPGTMERYILPIVGKSRLLYNPFFIAMGTTIPDFLAPEFSLVGTDARHPGILRDFYRSIHDAPVFVTTIKTAELTKVAYNTYIGMKIVFANTMMEICEKTGADVDDLTDALSLANQRIVSTSYMRGGMGDGGGCHPRDNIALSWLARELDLSHDLFNDLMVAREKQTEWLADQIVTAIDVDTDEVEIMGKAYKPGTALTVGSPALLLAAILNERGITYKHTDPYVEGEQDG